MLLIVSSSSSRLWYVLTIYQWKRKSEKRLWKVCTILLFRYDTHAGPRSVQSKSDEIEAMKEALREAENDRKDGTHVVFDDRTDD